MSGDMHRLPFSSGLTKNKYYNSTIGIEQELIYFIYSACELDPIYLYTGRRRRGSEETSRAESPVPRGDRNRVRAPSRSAPQREEGKAQRD